MQWYRSVLRLEFLVEAASPEAAESDVSWQIKMALGENFLTDSDASVYMVGMRFEAPNERDLTLIDEGIPPVVEKEVQP